MLATGSLAHRALAQPVLATGSLAHRALAQPVLDTIERLAVHLPPAPVYHPSTVDSCKTQCWRSTAWRAARWRNR